MFCGFSFFLKMLRVALLPLILEVKHANMYIYKKKKEPRILNYARMVDVFFFFFNMTVKVCCFYPFSSTYAKQRSPSAEFYDPQSVASLKYFRFGHYQQRLPSAWSAVFTYSDLCCCCCLFVLFVCFNYN